MSKKRVGPKIYILSDLEGVSGVDDIRMMERETAGFKAAVMHLAADINAAIAGAFEAGASSVTVRDGHGGGGNLPDGVIDKRAKIIPKRTIVELRECRRAPHDAALFVGMHAMAGTIASFLDHTQSSKAWFDYSINGRSTGEIGQLAATLGALDIPVQMVTGDEAACLEGTAFLGNIECVAVKRAISRNEARCYPLEEIRKQIRVTAAKAVKRIGELACYRPPLPREIKLTLCRTDMAEEILARSGPNTERLDARTIRKFTNDPLDLYF